MLPAIKFVIVLLRAARRRPHPAMVARAQVQLGAPRAPALPARLDPRPQAPVPLAQAVPQALGAPPADPPECQTADADRKVGYRYPLPIDILDAGKLRTRFPASPLALWRVERAKAPDVQVAGQLAAVIATSVGYGIRK